MSNSEEDKQHLSRRRFLAASCGMVAAAGLDAKAQTKALVTTNRVNEPIGGDTLNATESFWGEHQGGILTPVQSHTYFAALDLVASKREDVRDMFRAWTSAAARMADGQTADRSGRTSPCPGLIAPKPWTCLRRV